MNPQTRCLPRLGERQLHRRVNRRRGLAPTAHPWGQPGQTRGPAVPAVAASALASMPAVSRATSGKVPHGRSCLRGRPCGPSRRGVFAATNAATKALVATTMDPPAPTHCSHAQALMARLAAAVVALLGERPAPPAETFVRALGLLYSGQKALTAGLEVNLDLDADPGDDLDVAWPAPGRSALAGWSSRSPDRADQVSHPDLEEWLASSQDRVTGEADRRRVPIADLLGMDELFRHPAGPSAVAMTARDDKAPGTDARTASRGNGLLSRLAEAIYLVRAEAPTWSPPTRAQATALIRNATDELAERSAR